MAFCPFREKISVSTVEHLMGNYEKSICCKMAPLLLGNQAGDIALIKKETGKQITGGDKKCSRKC